MTYSFKSIAGYHEERGELQRLCSIINNRKALMLKGAKLPKGIIFYGPAGNGKTLFSKVLASECKLNTITIDLGNIKNVSSICKNIKKAFEKSSRGKSPTMIFFDELDKLLPNDGEEYYSDNSKAILTQLLTYIDGMESTGNVIFVATCNYYNELPETMVRPGRIDKKIAILNPTYESRVEILKMYAEKTICHFEMEMEEIARLCPSFSCAGLETFINECVLKADQNNFVSKSLITSVLSEIRNEDIPRKPSSLTDKIFAVRNLGNFVVAREFNKGSYILSSERDTVCNDFFNSVCAEFDCDYAGENTGNGYDDDDDYYDDDCKKDQTASIYRSRADYVNTITVLLGGYVAEELILNKIYDNVKYQLNVIDDILICISDCGMLGLKLHFNENRDNELKYTEERIKEINEELDKIVSEGYEKAKEIVTKNLKLIEHLLPHVLRGETLDNTKTEKLIADFQK